MPIALHAMGLLERIRSSLRSRPRPIDRLATIAAGYESLAAAIERHHALCRLGAIRDELRRLAAETAAQAAMIRGLSLARGITPAPAAQLAPNGANNWARLSGDLAAQMSLYRETLRALAELEGGDPELAAQLRLFAATEDRNLGALRRLALLCDPMALD